MTMVSSTNLPKQRHRFCSPWFLLLNSVLLIAAVSLLFAGRHPFQHKNNKSLASSDNTGGATDTSNTQSTIMSTPKTEWPELVGKDGEEAKKIIEGETAGTNIQQVSIVPYGYMVTADYREDRVRIYLGEDGTVDTVPRI